MRRLFNTLFYKQQQRTRLQLFSFNYTPTMAAPYHTKIVPVNPLHFQFEQTTHGDDFAEQNAKPVIADPKDQTAIEEAAQLLTAGDAVGIPTETVYGLAANALSADAVAKIFAAKNRPQDNPLIVHVSSLAMLKRILPNNTIPPVYQQVIKHHWPGPLTIIVPTSDLIPTQITCGQPTVAVRFPSHPVARALINQCDFPLAAPSANSSGKPSTTLASHVFDDLKGRIPLILDGGPCNVGVESTVLDGLRNPPAILRPGGVTYESLSSLPGMEGLQVYRKDFIDRALEQAPTTPGMKYRHYSPEAKVILLENAADPHTFERQWKQELEKQEKPVRRLGLLVTSKDTPSVVNHQGVECIPVFMGRGEHPEEVARGVFKGLRDLDTQNVDLIFVQGIPETAEGMAVMNRLRKAASKVIEL
ncbi:DHBP synthase RibB-like alpha/beta domain-containing protein [Zychaea mexicana]|uniref:DHBP synthase RibB-like alpha/beta domain-containing protein n=1 Tax=Zychaea mexicana TaxID=64656 RepID=UPI0022FDF145|nr:DHBP synthase RibB-like alpha/beta domain-containing protein [Zychaea mexicana]KAI9498520.1 DHBP synthase RibB-like alpha/beta domain-containing protein [Zychaea mexicana]